LKENRTAFFAARVLAAGLAVAAHAHVLAAEERRSAPDNVATAIESCVSQDWIHFGSGDQSAALDEADHQRIRAEMTRRYPMLGGDGFPSTRTILWQRAGGGLLYISVIDHPSQPGQTCFTATFAAERFDQTLMLRRKYLLPEEGGTR
jgi:hypothetical protein